MTAGIADTNILIELYRTFPGAQEWLANQRDIAITPVTRLEFMEGARGKSGQEHCQQIIAQFGLEYLTADDQRWAMTQLLKYRLSHGVSYADCPIASVAHRLQVPIYTRNARDFMPLLCATLVITPY